MQEKLFLPLPIFCLKAGYKFSFYWTQTLNSPGMAPEERNLQTNVTPLVSSHVFTFPTVCHSRKPKTVLSSYFSPVEDAK